MSGVASTRPAPTLECLAELARLSLDGSSEAIERILSLARAALDMDVAVVGAFDGDFVVQAVDGENEWFDLEVGSRIPVEPGDLPTLVHDAVADARTADLPMTRESGIGAYVGVPIRLWDGTLYGTLCCLSRSPEPSLNVRDVRFLRVLAEIVADQVDREQPPDPDGRAQQRIAEDRLQVAERDRRLVELAFAEEARRARRVDLAEVEPQPISLRDDPRRARPEEAKRPRDRRRRGPRLGQEVGRLRRDDRERPSPRGGRGQARAFQLGRDRLRVVAAKGPAATVGGGLPARAEPGAQRAGPRVGS